MLNIQLNLKTKQQTNAVIFGDIFGEFLCLYTPYHPARSYWLYPASLYQLVPKDIPIHLSSHRL